MLNLNVPNLPLAELRGVRAARLAPFGTVRTTLGETVDGRLQVELRATEDELDPDTDTAPGLQRQAQPRAGWRRSVRRPPLAAT